MINGLKVTALLIAWGNDAKNTIDVLGKPMLYYPASASRKSAVVDAWYCISDDEKILATAESIGYQRIQIPVEKAQLATQDSECVLYSLDVLEQRGELAPDILIVIFANNLTIKAQWITDCITMMAEDLTITSVVPVLQDSDHHPMWAKRINADGMLAVYDQNIIDKVSTNHQGQSDCFFPAKNFWVLNVQSVRSGQGAQPPLTIMGNRIIPYEIVEPVNINDLIQL